MKGQFLRPGEPHVEYLLGQEVERIAADSSIPFNLSPTNRLPDSPQLLFQSLFVSLVLNQAIP